MRTSIQRQPHSIALKQTLSSHLVYKTKKVKASGCVPKNEYLLLPSNDVFLSPKFLFFH